MEKLFKVFDSEQSLEDIVPHLADYVGYYLKERDFEKAFESIDSNGSIPDTVIAKMYDALSDACNDDGADFDEILSEFTDDDILYAMYDLL